MAKKKNVVIAEAAPVAAPECCEAEPCCCKEPEYDLDAARMAIWAAQTIPQILAVVYGAPKDKRPLLREAVAEARSRVLGVE